MKSFHNHSSIIAKNKKRIKHNRYGTATRENTGLYFFQTFGGNKLNQGFSKASTCFALANAIADQLDNEHCILVNPKSIADIIVNNNQHVGAIWPDLYDDYHQPILVMDENTGTWIYIIIRSVRRVKEFQERATHLLLYISKGGYHCVFVKEKIGEYYSCVNSWGNLDPYPRVPVEDPRNILWIVKVDLGKVPIS